MRVKARPEWTKADLLSVARLIVDPATNGGMVSPLAPEQVAPTIPDAPALAVFEEDRAVFVVGLNPYGPNPDGTAMRGVLHVAGDGSFPEAWRLVGKFLAALPDVEVFSLTGRPALARLAQRAGLQVIGEQNGYLILGR